jgi:hypothetical protein
MNDDDKKHKDQFDASLKLPGVDKTDDANPQKNPSGLCPGAGHRG